VIKVASEWAGLINTLSSSLRITDGTISSAEAPPANQAEPIEREIMPSETAFTGRKFKAVDSSDHNFTDAKIKRRMEEIESNISRYLAELDSADRREPAAAISKRVRLEKKLRH